MVKKLLKKLAVAATLVCMGATVAATAAACSIETDHPEVRITVEFNSVSYKLDYKLYRNMYPNTVRHFIELADNGIYNNMLVHDYGNNDWYSGGYEYDEEDYQETANTEAELSDAFADYLDRHSLDARYMSLFESGKLTSTVFANFKYNSNGNEILDRETKLPTLIGEFYNNINQEIKKGALSSEIGTLKMYYYGKETTNKVHVTPTDDQIIPLANYNMNCATSLFAMQIARGSTLSETNYCVFGKMESTKTLMSLVNAVDDYYSDHSANNIYVNNISVGAEIDSYVGQFLQDAGSGVEANFTLPALPIIIKSVKVTKY